MNVMIKKNSNHLKRIDFHQLKKSLHHWFNVKTLKEFPVVAAGFVSCGRDAAMHSGCLYHTCKDYRWNRIATAPLIQSENGKFVSLLFPVMCTQVTSRWHACICEATRTRGLTTLDSTQWLPVEKKNVLLTLVSAAFQLCRWFSSALRYKCMKGKYQDCAFPVNLSTTTFSDLVPAAHTMKPIVFCLLTFCWFSVASTNQQGEQTRSINRLRQTLDFIQMCQTRVQVSSSTITFFIALTSLVHNFLYSTNTSSSVSCRIKSRWWLRHSTTLR